MGPGQQCCSQNLDVGREYSRNGVWEEVPFPSQRKGLEREHSPLPRKFFDFFDANMQCIYAFLALF